MKQQYSQIESRSIFGNLELLADRLNKGSDLADDLIRGYEEKLGSLRLKIEVQLKGKLDLEDYSVLGYCKINPHGWVISVKDEFNPVPLLFQSRSVRIAAIEQLPDLVKALELEAGKQVLALEPHVVTLEELKQRLEGGSESLKAPGPGEVNETR